MLEAREILPSAGADTSAVSPLVLVHGWSGSSEWWSPLIERLGGTRHVLAVDLEGSNRAKQPPGGYSIQHQSEMLERTLADRDLPPAIVVGQSMGGLVAVDLARRAPERVTGLLLLAIPPHMSFIRVNLLGRLAFLPVAGRLVWHYGPDAVVRRGFAPLFGRGFSIPDWLLTEARGVTYRDARHLRDAIEGYLAEVHPRDVIARAGKPTVIAWGEGDQFWPIPAAAEYEGVAPIVRLPGVGHTPQVEAPERVIEEINRLAAGIAAANPATKR